MAFAEPFPETAETSADPETGGTLTIDLDAVEANWRTLTQRLLTVECAAVVKANAYGLGLEPVTAKLAKAGCKTFFVVDIAEARRVRTRARDASIYVLNGFSPGAGMAFAELSAQPVINSAAELAEWDAFVTAQNWRGGAAIHVDTGINRLGMPLDEAAALAPRVQSENQESRVDQPPRLRRDRRPSAQLKSNPALPRAAHALPGHSGLACQLLRHLPRRTSAFRFGETRRRFVRPQSDAG